MKRDVFIGILEQFDRKKYNKCKILAEECTVFDTFGTLFLTRWKGLREV